MLTKEKQIIRSDLYYAATLGTLKSGRLIEVQYQLDKLGSKRDFIDTI